MAAIGALFFVFLVFGGITAVVVGVIVWGQNAYKRRLATWARVAHQHGLAMIGTEIQGTKYGQRLRVCTVTRGSGNNRATYTVVSSQLPTPLDLGLNLRRHGFFNDMFHAAADIQIGDPPFDSRFLVSGDEPHRVRAVFTPPLRRLLLERLGTATFSLGDAGMSVECRGASSDEHWLGWAIELCARAAHKMDRARHHTPPAGPLLHHRQAWVTYARAAGLQGLDTPLCMWGRIGDHDVSVFSVRVDRLRFALQIQVRFATPLRIGLAVKERHGMIDAVAVFFGGQDHRLGDPLFDRTFRVKASDPERATALLHESVRRELLWVRSQIGPPIVDDHGLSVRLPTVPHEPTIVPRVVHQLTGLAERLSARGPGATTGPYR